MSDNSFKSLSTSTAVEAVNALDAVPSAEGDAMSQPAADRREILRAQDLNLPFLASQAAIELDNRLLGSANGLDSVKALADRLRNATEPVNGSEKRRPLMDLPTLNVFCSALTASQGHGVKTLSDLAGEAARLAGDLDSSSVNDDNQQLTQLRSFCVALSRAASAYLQSVQQMEPTHPFRR
jgi:hypothetical protein